MPEAFDAYYKWLGIPSEEQPPNHYRLLGIGMFESDPDVISNAADQRMVHIRSFQTGQHSTLSQKLLNELAAARICLLNAAKKAEYDAKLQQELALKQPANSADAPRIELDFDVSPRPRSPVHKASPKTGLPFGQILVMVALGVLLLFAAVAVILRGGGQKPVIKSDPDNRNPETNSAQQASSELGKVGSPATELRPPPPKLSSAELQAAEPKESSPIAVDLPLPAEPKAPTDPAEKVAEHVKAAFAKAKTPADFRTVAVDAFKLMEQANAAGKRDIAQSAVAVALTAARKAEDDELVKTATICVLDPESKPVVNEDPSWIDILPRVDLQRDRVAGDWETTGKAVTVNKAPWPKLMLPVKIDGDYDLLLRFTRYAGSDTLYVILPVESHFCAVVLSSWAGGWSALELVDGQESKNNNNPTLRQPSTLTNGREYTLLVKVRQQNQMVAIEALLDNSLLFHWEGKPSSLSFLGDRNLPEPQRIGLGANDSQVTFHSAKLPLNFRQGFMGRRR